MKIKELFEVASQTVGVAPGSKIGPTPPGARPTGDSSTSVTQGPPSTSNTPKTAGATGFTPVATAPTLSVTPDQQPDDGSAISAVTPATTTAPTGQPDATQQAAMGVKQQGMEQELEGLKAMIQKMQGQLAPQQPK